MEQREVAGNTLLQGLGYCYGTATHLQLGMKIHKPCALSSPAPDRGDCTCSIELIASIIWLLLEIQICDKTNSQTVPCIHTVLELI